MAMHNTNSLLKYVIPAAIFALLLVWFILPSHHNDEKHTKAELKKSNVKGNASHDSAAESLDTLTASIVEIKQDFNVEKKERLALKEQMSSILREVNANNKKEIDNLNKKLKNYAQERNNLHSTTETSYHITTNENSQTITTVPDLYQGKSTASIKQPIIGKQSDKPKPIPVYTIPANATSVRDHLMTALVGRIPVKNAVTDPYPFKIVVSDDNLAANGLRIPNLVQMIVSGYCEGDLNLVSVRGWITSLTFVFADGTISTTTSNDNNIGRFTKENSLGYLSDKYGNPFISGKLISNAPAFLAGNVLLKGANGAATAYSQSQTTNNSSFLGNSQSSITGSPGKYIAGQALANSTDGALSWWQDRQQQSFDAIYVAPTDQSGNYTEIAVNFSKAINIDYDPAGRKLSYDQTHFNNNPVHLD